MTIGTAATGGDGKYSYRWYKNGSLIAGANAETYTPKAEDAAVAAGTIIEYTREAKDGECAAWTWSSGTYKLLTSTPPTVTMETPTVTACNGGNFVVGVSAGTSYTWQKYENGQWKDTTVTTQTLTDSKNAAGKYYYRARVYVENSSGTCTADVYSPAATVTVREAFSAGSFTVSEGAACVNVQPQAITGVSAPKGGSDDTKYAYTWYKDGGTTPIDGATAATYQPSASTVAGIFKYTRKVTLAECSINNALTDGTFTLKVGSTDLPTTNIVPDQTPVCNNTASTLTAGKVTDAQSYAWQTSSNGVDWAAATSTGTNNSITVPGQTAAGDYYYKVTVTASKTGCGSTYTSTPATITVREAFNAGKFNTTAGNACPGATPAAITGVSAPTGGDGNYTYQWYHKVGASNVALIDGATEATHQPGTFTDNTTVVYTRAAKD
jgi:hypothetical protein